MLSSMFGLHSQNGTFNIDMLKSRLDVQWVRYHFYLMKSSLRWFNSREFHNDLHILRPLASERLYIYGIPYAQNTYMLDRVHLFSVNYVNNDRV